jgi:hypothetical protein
MSKSKQSETDTRPGSSSERSKQYERLHRSPEIRAALIKKLEDMSEQFPMMRLGQILASTGVPDLFSAEDDQLLRELDQLYITLMQFRTAGAKL